MGVASLASDELFAGIVERGRVRNTTADRAWLRALLRAESVLASAQASAGVIPTEAAAVIVAVCGRPQDFALATLARDTGLGGNPVIPLVSALRARVPKAYAPWVHHGSTSQDILDTAMMLVAKRSLDVIGTDTDAAAAAIDDLAGHYGTAPLMGRTLMQAAMPITFGAKTAGWASGLAAGRERISRVAAGLPIQLGGPVGVVDLTDDRRSAVAAAYARRLGLVESSPWHTNRVPIADLAGALATLAGVADKIARDIVLLAQSEVREVRENASGRGGSSSMAHKHNPIAAISASASARRAPALAGQLFASMAHEHERAAGAWHAEWVPLIDLLRTTGSAICWLADSLSHLEIDTEAMAANIQRTTDT
jgi:3-carboxy-cis,cis-muconate cycloisomerase